MAPDNLVNDLAQNGYAFIPGVLDDRTCDALEAAISLCRRNPGPTFRTLSPAGTPVVQSELFRWPDVDALRAVTHEGLLPKLAARAFQTDSVILMEDQWFYSEEGASTPSPWHQDHPYHPLEPWFLTIWIPLDDPPGNVSLKVAAGSHLGPTYAPVEFSAGSATLGSADGALSSVPDVDRDPDAWRVITPPAKRGDAVLLDSRTLHAAGGLCTDTFQRLSVRFAHPQTVVQPRYWPVAQFWSDHAFASIKGAAIDGEHFPLLAVG
ncbi:MAG: phytanoyl-CoA dioxygenase family protein [Pseudomonadota bacterium]